MSKRLKLPSLPGTHETRPNLFMALPPEVMIQELASMLPFHERIYLLCRLCKELAARYDRLDAIGTHRAPVKIGWWMHCDQPVISVKLYTFLRARIGTGPMVATLSCDYAGQGPGMSIADDHSMPLHIVSVQCVTYVCASLLAAALPMLNVTRTLELEFDAEFAHDPPIESADLCTALPLLRVVRLCGRATTRHPTWRERRLHWLSRLLQQLPHAQVEWDTFLQFFPDELGIAPERIQRVIGIDLNDCLPPYKPDVTSDAVLQGRAHVLCMADELRLGGASSATPAQMRLLEYCEASMPASVVYHLRLYDTHEYLPAVYARVITKLFIPVTRTSGPAFASFVRDLPTFPRLRHLIFYTTDTDIRCRLYEELYEELHAVCTPVDGIRIANDEDLGVELSSPEVFSQSMLIAIFSTQLSIKTFVQRIILYM